MKIKTNNEMTLKLLTAQMLVESSKEKLNLYFNKNLNIAAKIHEDEESFKLMNDYYEDNYHELKEWAEDSNSDEFKLNYFGHEEIED